MLSRLQQLPLLVRLTLAWGVVFGVFHLYWAAGGSAGMDDPATDLGAQLYIGVVALVGFASAGVALGLVQPWGLRVGRGRLRLLARAGSIALALGVAVSAVRWIADPASFGGDGVGGVTIWLYFLAGSVLFHLLARRAGDAGERGHRGATRATSC